MIEFAVFQLGEEDTCSLNHSGKFARGDRNINIGNTCCALILATDFKFLCGTGHNRNADNVLRINIILFGIVGLKNSTKHLLRRFAGRKMRKHLGEIMLAILDPTGRARSDHRQNTAVLNTLDQFIGFFHNGKVGGNIGIKDLIKAQLLKSGYHLAFHIGADRHIKGFTQSYTDGRSHLNNNMLGGIRHCFPNLIGIILFSQRAGGASHNTLTAGYARSQTQTIIESRADVGGETALVCTNNRDTLPFIANRYATAAKDTFIIIANHMDGGIINIECINIAIECIFLIHAIFIAKTLQFARTGTNAGKTLLIVIGKDQFQRLLSCLLHHRAMGVYLHSLGNRKYASGNQTAHTVYSVFNNADTASTDRIDLFQKAQSRNINIIHSGSFQNRCTGRYADGNAIDL